MAERLSKQAAYIISAALLSLGLIVLGFIVSAAAVDLRRGERTVSVKGLVERDVKADFVQYNFSFVASGEVLADTYARIRADQEKVVAFLNLSNIPPQDYTFSLSTVDRKAQQYGGNNSEASRFIITSAVTLNSQKVDEVAKMTQKMGALVDGGIVMGESSTLSYRFQNLNQFKPEMLAEATKNARSAANQFARDSGDKVGSIKTANQGVFSINAKGENAENDAAINKTIRVVTTVEYFLEN